MTRLFLGTLFFGIVTSSCNAMSGRLLFLEQKSNTTVGTKCVQIFYDGAKRSEKQFGYGRTMALYLQNLLGHFVNVQQVISPIERYAKGGLDQCPYNFYLGSNFDNPLPKDFIADFKTSPSHVVWLGYNMWQLGDAVTQEKFGASYLSIAEIDKKNLDAQGIPGFFRLYEYLGETFIKYAAVNSSGTLDAVYDIVKVKITDPSVKVIAWAKHSTLNEKVPYILRKQNRWFVADLPFPYMNEEDRYLIFSDVLFDMIEEKPLRTEKLATVRLEDVHAALPLAQVRAFYEASKRQNVKFITSVIPIFNDPYLVYGVPGAPKRQTIGENPAFAQLLHEMMDSGMVTIAMHGVTHQSDERKNPLGVSGMDYEFWDVVLNKAMPDDNARDLIKRLELGVSELTKVGIVPSLWVTPHYAASTMNTWVLGQSFDWVMGRLLYQPFLATQKTKLPQNMRFSRPSSEFEGVRDSFFTDLNVEMGKDSPLSEQFFPYEIYGDATGSRVIPENIGYLTPKKNVPGSLLVDNMLQRLKRNRVLRDYWGSFFLHPYLSNSVANGGIGAFEGDTREIERFFSEAQKMGYRFISAKEWVKDKGNLMRPEPLEIR